MPKCAHVVWQDDPQAENLMRNMGVPWVIQDVSVNAIDWSESHSNGARIGSPLMRDSIDAISMAMRHNSKIPRPIVYTPKGRMLYVIVSGNQRLNAYKETGDHAKKVPCYVAKFEDELTFETLLRVTNVVNGVPLSPSDRREHAFYCVKRLGMKTADAAKFFLVSEPTICDYVRAIETRVELDRARVPNVERLNQSHLSALGRVSDDSMRRTLATLATQHMPSGDRVNQVAAVVDKARSRTEQLKALKEFEKELSDTCKPKTSDTPRPAIGRPRRDKVFNMLSSLAGFLEKGIDGTGFTDVTQLQCDRPEDRVKLNALWKRVAVRMNLLAE